MQQIKRRTERPGHHIMRTYTSSDMDYRKGSALDLRLKNILLISKCDTFVNLFLR